MPVICGIFIGSIQFQVSLGWHCLISLKNVNELITDLTHNLLFTGSASPIPCPGGQYCNIPGLPLPTGFCSAGYYCILRASIETPSDGSTGDICPAGHYCESGVASPVPCSPGTYSTSIGNTQVSYQLMSLEAISLKI